MNVRTFIIGWFFFSHEPWCLASLYKFDIQSVANKPFTRYIHSMHVFSFPPHSCLVIWNLICMYTSPHLSIYMQVLEQTRIWNSRSFNSYCYIDIMCWGGNMSNHFMGTWLSILCADVEWYIVTCMIWWLVWEFDVAMATCSWMRKG